MGRKSAGIPQQQQVPPQPVVWLRTDVLNVLFAGTGIRGYVHRAKFLGCSTASLYRAGRGEPVNASVIAAIRYKFPLVPYEASFVEGVAPRVSTAKQAA